MTLIRSHRKLFLPVGVRILSGSLVAVGLSVLMLCSSWDKDEIWEKMSHGLPEGEVPALSYMFSCNSYLAVAPTASRSTGLAFLGQRPQTTHCHSLAVSRAQRSVSSVGSTKPDQLEQELFNQFRQRGSQCQRYREYNTRRESSPAGDAYALGRLSAGPTSTGCWVLLLPEVLG